MPAYLKASREDSSWGKKIGQQSFFSVKGKKKLRQTGRRDKHRTYKAPSFIMVNWETSLFLFGQGEEAGVIT